MGTIKPIQSVRFFGFLLVFSLHAKMWIVDTPPQFELMTSGGVILFLMLSGALGTYSLAQKELDVSFKGIFKFVKKKLVKYYPLYLITNIYTISYYGPIRYLGQHDYINLKKSISEFIYTVLMIQPFTKSPFAYNGVGWFLASLIWFSILTIPVEAVCRKIRKNPYCILFFLMGIIGCYYANSWSNFLVSKAELDLGVAHPIFTVWVYIGGLIIGNIVLVLRDKWCSTNSLGIEVTFSVIEVLLVVLACALFFVPSNYTALVSILYIFAFAGIVFVFMLGKGKISSLLSNRFLVGLGNIGFECYMIHQIIIHEYCQNNGWEGYGRKGGFFAYVFCLGLTVIFSKIINLAHQSVSTKMK